MSEREHSNGVVWGPFGEVAGRETVPGITMRPMTGERLMLCWVDLLPHAVLPEHHHPHEQGGVVLEGELNLTIDGVDRRCGPGDGFIIPGDVPHSAVAGPNGAQTLDVFTPPREDFRS